MRPPRGIDRRGAEMMERLAKGCSDSILCAALRLRALCGRFAVSFRATIVRGAVMLVGVANVSAVEPASWLAELLSPELRRIEQRRETIELELAALGAPVVGQTAEQFGYQHPRLDAPPLNSAWV